MRSQEFILTEAASELAKRLPSLAKHDYNTIDDLMRKVAAKHRMSKDALRDLFVRKFKKSPNSWVSKLDEGFTTNDLVKPIISHLRENGAPSNISLHFSALTRKHYGRTLTAESAYWHNGTLATHRELQENFSPEIKSFHDAMKNRISNNSVPIAVGAKVCALQTKVNIYDNTILCSGFRNPKTIVGFTIDPHDEQKITELQFDDNTTFPEKYEFSTTDTGIDLMDTLFFSSAKDFDNMLTVLEIIKPEKFRLGTRAITESTLPKSDMPIEENPITEEFIKWAVDVLHMESQPEVQFSYDTEEAQGGHHTGRHTVGENSVWVYVANRNMVDVFRTIFHEFVHVRQGELNMIKPGSSYPGSPIEAEADIMAGKYIKIFGKDHPEIFQ